MRALALVALLALPAWGQSSSITLTAASYNVPVADSTAPEAISDLAADVVSNSRCDLEWSAPNEDGSVGSAVASYECKYREGTSFVEGDWASALDISGEPGTPGAPDATETLQVTGLDASTQYAFACKSTDDASNESAISNAATCTTNSGGTADLMAESFDPTGYDLSWTETGTGGSAVIDEDASVTGLGTGFSGQALQVAVTADFATPVTTHTLASPHTTGPMYCRANFRLTSEELDDAHVVNLVTMLGAVHTINRTETPAAIELSQASGTLSLCFSILFADCNASIVPSLNTAYRLEWKTDRTAPYPWEFKVNGSSVASGNSNPGGYCSTTTDLACAVDADCVSPETCVLSTTRVLIGLESVGGTAPYGLVYHLDDFECGSTDWIGP